MNSFTEISVVLARLAQELQFHIFILFVGTGIFLSSYNVVLSMIFSLHLIKICFSCRVDIILCDTSQYKIL